MVHGVLRDLLLLHTTAVSGARAEVAVATVLLLGSTVMALSSGAGLAVVETGVVASSAETPGFAVLLLQILGTNLAAACLMFAGLLTFGLAAAAMAAAAGLYLGHSVATAVAALGTAEVVARAWLYTPLEVYGLVLAVASGLTGVTEALFRDHAGPVEAARQARRRSLGLIVQAICVLILAAVLEAASTALRAP